MCLLPLLLGGVVLFLRALNAAAGFHSIAPSEFDVLVGCAALPFVDFLHLVGLAVPAIGLSVKPPRAFAGILVRASERRLGRLARVLALDGRLVFCVCRGSGVELRDLNLLVAFGVRVLEVAFRRLAGVQNRIPLAL